jgi:hypothetical protein
MKSTAHLLMRDVERTMEESIAQLASFVRSHHRDPLVKEVEEMVAF